jgi:hypothetical protein
MIHGSMTAAHAQVEKALAEARDAGKFMVAVWVPDEQGRLICHRTTWQFPTERFAEAIGQLNQMLEEERNPPRGPLPLASFLRRPNSVPMPVGTPVEMDEQLGGDPCDE